MTDPRLEGMSAHRLLQELERLHQLEETASDVLQRVKTLREQITAHLAALDEHSRLRLEALKKEREKGES